MKYKYLLILILSSLMLFVLFDIYVEEQNKNQSVSTLNDTNVSNATAYMLPDTDMINEINNFILSNNVIFGR